MEPRDVSAIRASIWKCGALEISFHEGCVFLLVLHAPEWRAEWVERMDDAELREPAPPS